MDHRVFKNWIDQVWAPFALEKGDRTYLLMDEFSAHFMPSCSNQINGCGTTIDYILGGYTSKIQLMILVSTSHSGAMLDRHMRTYDWGYLK